ncbi:MAG: hypothetical protein IT200_14320 [Thermoleophilia bacterium]|nr:hypothetical protein [Thermoleophilia bacterium]
MTSSPEPRTSRTRRLRRWLATTGLVAVAAIALGAGTAGAYHGSWYDDDADDQIVAVEDSWSPPWGGGHILAKRSW